MIFLAFKKSKFYNYFHPNFIEISNKSKNIDIADIRKLNDINVELIYHPLLIIKCMDMYAF